MPFFNDNDNLTMKNIVIRILQHEQKRQKKFFHIFPIAEIYINKKKKKYFKHPRTSYHSFHFAEKLSGKW